MELVPVAPGSGSDPPVEVSIVGICVGGRSSGFTTSGMLPGVDWPNEGEMTLLVFSTVSVVRAGPEFGEEPAVEECIVDIPSCDGGRLVGIPA